MAELQLPKLIARVRFSSPALCSQRVTKKKSAALRAPIGLDIGADQPAEIALTIQIEVVAVRSGRLASTSGSVTSIGVGDGAIHPESAPGEAACPGG